MSGTYRKYGVEMPYNWPDEDEMIHEIFEWMDSEIGSEKCGRSFRGNWYFDFDHETDAVAFKLRWV